MGRLKFLLFFAIAATVLVLLGSLVMGQPASGLQGDKSEGSIQGTVRDAEKLPLPGVLVSLKGTSFSVVTDDYGNYRLSGVPGGTWSLTASLSGFETSERTVELAPGQRVTLEIELQVAQLNYEVTVKYDVPKLMDASQNIGVVSIAPAQIANLPSLGEKDIFRSLQLMPGISASNEASAGLYVRGGTPDQNLVLFDGFTVYDVDHFYGIFSAFNARAVENITMHKGGFEAKYGGRISSVLELDGRSGNNEEVAIGGGASLLSYNGYTEVPISRKASALFAGRRSFQSPLSDRIRNSYNVNQSPGGPGGGPGGGGPMAVQPDSTFYDVNARLTYNLSRRDRFFVSLYNGQDNLDSSREMSLPGGFGDQTRPISGKITNLSRWGNTGVSLNWSHQWFQSLNSSLTLAHSRYFKVRDRSSSMTIVDPDTDEETTTERGSGENNRLTDYTVSLDNALSLGHSHLIEFGLRSTRNAVNYDFRMNEADAGMNRSQIGSHHSLYLQDRWLSIGRLTLTPGLRATYYDRSKRTYLEPRLSVIVDASKRLRFKAAGGLYYQFANNLVREDVLEGDQDFWTLGDGGAVPVSSAVHSIVGLSYETDSYLFDIEGYRKDLKGLAEFGSMRFFGRPGAFLPPPGQPPDEGEREPINFTNLFFRGSGEAQGIEFLLQKKFGANTGWVTYTLGRVNHLFPELSSAWYPASHDSTHEFKLVDSWRYGRWTVSGTWLFATGKPFTGPTGVEEITLPNGRTFSVPEFGGKNEARLPDYHRLDASVTRDLYVGERSKATAGLSVFNAYNRANVWRREYDVVEEELIPTDVNYLGFTVSAFVNVDLSLPSLERRAGPAWKNSSGGVENGEQQDAAAADGSGKAKAQARPDSRVYDFEGTVEGMTPTKLTVRSKWGTRSFAINDASISGQHSYSSGTPVHVYYKRQDDQDLVTMVFRKVK